jgi:hypothetical protein
MGDASTDLMKLRPVTFRYKQAQEDGSHPLQYGLVAEEVAAVNPGLVQFDKDGNPQTVLYHVLPARSTPRRPIGPNRVRGQKHPSTQ